MLEQKPEIQKLVLPNSNSPEKSEPRSDRKIDPEAAKWKSKSLNSLPIERYEIDITKSASQKPLPIQKESKKSKNPPAQNEEKKNTESGQKILPQPKIKKINEKMFCMIINNLLKVFYFRMTPKTQNDKNTCSFSWKDYEISSNIEFVTGNNSDCIFLGTQNQLIILYLQKNEDTYIIKEKTRKSIPKIRTVTFIGDEMIVVSSELIYQFSLTGNFDPLAKKAIEFKSESEKKLFNQLKPINLVVESAFCFYYFGSKNEQKVDFTMKRKFNIDADAKPPSKMSQILHIVKFQIQHNTESWETNKPSIDGLDTGVKKTRYMSQTQLVESKILSIKTEIYQIDHVFEVGIFDKSKLYELDENIFLMSLYEEIILIKKHFNKYIVWDNVSIVSSKSQEKKGQLVLADKRILVYSENDQIFAHDIYFNEEESRINMPPIDSFKGNDSDDQILYDAVLLEYDNDSMMKVLFYFKQNDVILPNKSKFRREPDNPNEQQRDQNKLHFTVLCINQSQPEEKLKQMLVKKKPPNEIAEFCERFGIRPLQKTKCMWSVSEKSLKDIENVLLEISDDDYIQLQLENILKKEPHNLTFLASVQTKQIARLKKLIVKNLLNDSTTGQMGSPSQFNDSKNPSMSKSDYVQKVIQWLMESIMFEKKLKYSQKFLSFKEYDFIEIGKLKAASLKEEIKLLSCKKYQKRLKYFLNSFRILAIANWQQIFTFLLANKNEAQIKQFLIDFRFILPKFTETSSVFQKKGTYGINKLQKLKVQDGEKDEEKCELWDDLQGIREIITEGILNAGQPKIAETIENSDAPLNTIEDFFNMIVDNIKGLKKDVRTQNEAMMNFEHLLGEVKNSDWFKNAAFKQHSMLDLSSQVLQQRFLELRNKKAYQILVQYLYRQIESGKSDITEEGIDKMLESFIDEYCLVPESFKRNDDARLQVYELMKDLHRQHKMTFNMKISQFLVLDQDQYFLTLFGSCRDQILTSIKKSYDDIEEGFFRERFQLFLESEKVKLSQIIKFLDFFDGSKADDVRVDVFNCIKKLLKITDFENTKDFIEKSLEKEVLPERSNEMNNPDSIDMNLREEAKIPYGFAFHKFFTVFKLEYTYEGLIEATKHANLKTNDFLQELMRKYCKNEYEITEDFYSNQQCLLEFEDNKILNQKLNPVNIHNRPLDFFGLLLYLVDVLDFQVIQKELYELMIENYLNEGMSIEQKNFNNSLKAMAANKFEELWNFVKSLNNYIISADDIHSKNYQLINSFKDDHDPQQIFVDYTINWINSKYGKIKTKELIEPTLISVKKVLEILKRSNKSAKEVKKMDAFYQMLGLLKKFNSEMMMKINFIKKEQEEHGGFIFLIHMFREIGVDNFRAKDPEEDKQSQEEFLGKKVPENVETNNTVLNWACIYSQYKIIREQENIEARESPEFIRFIVEICSIMVAEEKYSIAWDLLIRAVNQGYYFRDAFYYLASCLKIQNKLEFTKAFRSFLSTQTTKSLQQKLNIMLNGNTGQIHAPGKVLSLPNELIQPSRLKNEKGDVQTVDKKKNALFLFQELIETNRADEAFFFLVKFKFIRNNQIQKICIDSKRLTPVGFNSYLLLTTYMRCLEKYISDEFYPTFLFFKLKYQILIDDLQRKDIIKDINIAVSRLQSKIAAQDNEARKKDIEEYRKELKHYYSKFMKFIDQPEEIKLTQEDEDQATRRIQNYARDIPDLLEEQFKQENVAKLKLQENHQKIQKVHENNKLNVVHKDIVESISMAKQTADKYAAILEEKKKQSNKMTYAEKKEQQLEEIRRKEQEDVSSIKDSFKSNTCERVNNLIESVRKKRQMIQQSRYKIETNLEDGERHGYPFMPQVPQKDQPNLFKKIQARQLPESKYNVPSFNININPVNRPVNNLLDNHPINTMLKASQIVENAKKSFIQNQGQFEPKTSEKYMELQKKFKGLQQPVVSRPKVTLEEITDIFKNKEPESLAFLEKFDLIKQKLDLAAQLLMRIFSVIKDLSNFLQLLRYLLSADERYKDVIEEKSIAIVGQMIKMDQKINLKQLIPVELFLQVHSGMTVKDYYFKVYEVLRPNIKKILAQEKIAAHALGILMRYSLGSETKYFHRVFEDYIRVLLKNFESKVFDEKETFVLAEKLRSQFTNLEQEGRQMLFEGLISEMGNEGKKKKIVEGLRKAIKRKTESAVSGGHMQELARVVTRLEKRLKMSE